MSELCGVFVVDKDAGWTSFDVVAKMRGICHMKKIGHTGTLDPMATGVLPVCVGKATKIVSLLTDDTKTYRAGIRLGYESDTQDVTGEMKRTASEEAVAAVTTDDLRVAAAAFTGGYEQVPPMYSAKHHEGKRLYELAREGQQVDRAPVPVSIEAIDIASLEAGEAVITVTCGKGTYIRTLIEDIGRKLGCGAVMSSLRRIRSGRFEESGARTIAQLQELADQDRLEEALIPVDQVFDSYPRVVIGDPYEKAALNGNPLPAEAVGQEAAAGRMTRIYTADDTFVGLFAADSERGLWRPQIMFI